MQRFTVICPNCDAHHREPIDDDGRVMVPGRACDAPDCNTHLCPECPRVRCEACGGEFCDRHMIVTVDGVHFCGECAQGEEVRAWVLDYEDGGELECGVCGRACMQHFRNRERNDIGECCRNRVVVMPRRFRPPTAA